MRLVLALTAAVLLASPSGPAGARDTCHGPSCTHGVPGSGPGGSPGAGHQGGTPGSTCDSANGTCTNAPSVSCTADSDCGTECSIASSADSCQTAGGTVGTGTTCCAACTTTTTSVTTTTTTTMTP